MPDRMEYQITLQKDGQFDTYDPFPYLRHRTMRRCRKLGDLAHSFDYEPEDAWLLVVTSGKINATMRPGEF